jgi:hypothetical protein
LLSEPSGLPWVLSGRRANPRDTRNAHRAAVKSSYARCAEFGRQRFPNPRVSSYTLGMPIDGCTHSFQHLAGVVLPAHMERMRQVIVRPVPMETFFGTKRGPVTCAKRLGLRADFTGCYVLIEKGKAVYVGISRSVLARLGQHVKGKTHFDASLAYLIAKKANPHQLDRTKAMADATFRSAFDNAKAYIRSLDAAFIEIPCPVELYAFELYCSLELNTDQWNTFRTH